MGTFRDRVAAWIGGNRTATLPIGWNPSIQAAFGQALGNQPSHETLLAENLGIVDTATRAIANRLSSIEPQVKSRRLVSAGSYVEEIIDDHPLKALLDQPHPNLSRRQLLRLTGQWIVTVGEAYWLKVDNGLNVPTELHPVPPAQIEPAVRQGIVEGYMATDGDGKRFELPTDVVIRFFFPDPEQPWASEGYFGPNGITADARKFASQHLRRHYEHDATPKSALEPQEGAQTFDAAQAARFRELWSQLYNSRNGRAQGAPGIVPSNYKLVELAMQSGADVTPLLEHWRDDLLMAFGVPRSILGQVVSGDRSSAETNQYVFDQHTVLPIAQMIEDALTLQLAKDFEGGVFVCFENFVASDKQFSLAQEQSDLDRKVRSINSVLESRGESSVDWGDEPVGKVGEIPYTGEGFEFPPMESGQTPSDGEATAEPQEKQYGKFDEGEAITGSSVLNGAQVASIVQLVQGVADGTLHKPGAVELMGVAFGIDAAVAAKIIGDPRPSADTAALAGRVRSRLERFGLSNAPLAPGVAWQRQQGQEARYIPAFYTTLLSLLTLQKRSVLERLGERLGSSWENRSKGDPRLRGLADELFQPSQWRKLFERRLEPIREKAYVSGLRSTLGDLGVEDFVFTDAAKAALRRDGARLVGWALKTTRTALVEQIEQGLTDGESVEQIATRIRKTFKRRRNEAITTARTEVLKATSRATLDGFKLAGVKSMRWHTSLDDAVRETHQEMEGKTVPVGEPFVMPRLDGGTEYAAAPRQGFRGSALSAGNTINCRCFLVPVSRVVME